LRKFQLTAFILLAVTLALDSCRDIPRDNPYDPETDVLLVSVLSPGDSTSFYAGDSITFRVTARTGFDNAPAGDTFLWRSNISGPVSTSAEFTIGSLPPGNHRITVTVTDSQNRHGTKEIRVIINKVPDFGVIITNPPDTIFVIGSGFTPSAREYVAEGSTIIGRLWSFGTGSGIANSTVRDPGPVVYNLPGVFQIIYQIVDDQGRTAADTVIVEVLSESVPAVVEISSPSTDTTVSRDDSLFFDAVEIVTSARIARRGWIYPQGSGLEMLEDTVASVGWRIMTRPGIFEIIYRVIDVLGVPAADTVTVTVNDTLSQPSVAIISPQSDDTTVVAGDSIWFEGFLIPDRAEGISQAWDYGPQSGIDASADTIKVPGWRTFNQSGEHWVSYSAVDLSGRGSKDSLKVTVVENQPPSATIIEPSAADILVGRGLSVAFRATDSDPEGRPLIRFWLWGEGSGIDASASDSVADPGTRTFNNTGNFTVSYNVIDDKGLQDADTVNVTVAENQPPSAQIIVPSVDTTIAAWSEIVFSGTDSDPDGTIVSRSWSYGTGSGVSAEGDTTVTSEPRMFSIPGIFDVIYSVVDNMFGAASDTAKITVQANGRPQATIYSPAGVVTIAVGDSISFIAVDSDPDGPVVYRNWNYGVGSGIPDDAIAFPDYRTFNIAGEFAVVYVVRDNVGGVCADTVVVTVSP